MKKVRRQLTEWKKVFANYMYKKDLLSRIYKELLDYNNKEKKNFKKWAKDLNRHFSKEDYKWLVRKHMKKNAYH